jgi:hypothetical protein
MTNRSRFDRERRAAEDERIQQIAASWQGRISAADQAAFRQQVELAWAYRPEPRQDMAPGTAPNPPRPGREPRPPKGSETKRASWS